MYSISTETYYCLTPYDSGIFQFPAPIRMTLNDLECPIHLKVRLVLSSSAWRTFVAGFGFDHTHRCSQSGRRGSELEGLPPPCGQLARCFSAVAELLVQFPALTSGTVFRQSPPYVTSAPSLAIFRQRLKTFSLSFFISGLNRRTCNLSFGSSPAPLTSCLDKEWLRSSTADNYTGICLSVGLFPIRWLKSYMYAILPSELLDVEMQTPFCCRRAKAGSPVSSALLQAHQPVVLFAIDRRKNRIKRWHDTLT